MAARRPRPLRHREDDDRGGLWADAVCRSGRTATVTVKVDTGLNRNGVAPAHYPAMLTALRQAAAEDGHPATRTSHSRSLECADSQNTKARSVWHVGDVGQARLAYRTDNLRPVVVVVLALGGGAAGVPELTWPVDRLRRSIGVRGA